MTCCGIAVNGIVDVVSVVVDIADHVKAVVVSLKQYKLSRP